MKKGVLRMEKQDREIKSIKRTIRIKPSIFKMLMTYGKEKNLNALTDIIESLMLLANDTKEEE
jgi:hypothetical protein